MQKELDKNSGRWISSIMKNVIIIAVCTIFIFLSGCSGRSNRDKSNASQGKSIYPVKYEAFVGTKRIGYASIDLLDTQLSDIRFYDADEKLILMLMPEFDGALSKVHWTLLSRSFSAQYEYKDNHPDKITFDGDSYFSIVRFLEESGSLLKRVIAIAVNGKKEIRENSRLESLDIEYEYADGNHRISAAIFNVNDYDAPAGYLIYHSNEAGNISSIDYKNTLMKKHPAYQIKVSYSGQGKADQELLNQIDQILFLPVPVIFEWILD